MLVRALRGSGVNDNVPVRMSSVLDITLCTDVVPVDEPFDIVAIPTVRMIVIRSRIVDLNAEVEIIIVPRKGYESGCALPRVVLEGLNLVRRTISGILDAVDLDGCFRCFEFDRISRRNGSRSCGCECRDQ